MFSLFLLGFCVSSVVGSRVERRQQASGHNCVKQCPGDQYPVCASDGKTYFNGCQLQIAQCLQQQAGRALHVIHYGHCGGDHVVTTVTQRNCDQICDEVLDFVCASDGVTYKNTCLYQRAECEAAKNGTQLFIVSYGDSCSKPMAPECNKYRTDTSDLAMEAGTHIASVICSSTHQYVCASDGNTYSNECLLCHYMDLHPTKSDLMILRNGTCHAHISHANNWLVNIG